MIKNYLLFIFLAVASCSNQSEQLRAAGPVFGTTYSILYESERKL